MSKWKYGSSNARWKVIVEIQDGCRKDAQGIRNIDFGLECAYYLI